MAGLVIVVRRVYDPVEPDNGYRVLVDRLWPRGLRKEDIRVDAWPKALTPSPELRRDLHAGREREEGFRRRYLDELAGEEARTARSDLLKQAGARPLILLTAVREPEHSHVPVLVGFLREGPA